MKNKNTALITGGSQRIGKEMAISLAKKGYNLVIHYNNSKEQATQLIQELKKKDVESKQKITSQEQLNQQQKYINELREQLRKQQEILNNQQIIINLLTNNTVGKID